MRLCIGGLLKVDDCANICGSVSMHMRVYIYLWAQALAACYLHRSYRLWIINQCNGTCNDIHLGSIWEVFVFALLILFYCGKKT